IFATAIFFIVVMLTLLLLMKGTPTGPGWFASDASGDMQWSKFFPQFTLRQVSIFFTVYVVFQVWNEINCRSLAPEVSVLHGLWQARIFLGVVGLILGGKGLILTFGGAVFQVQPLGWTEWLVIMAGTGSVVVYAEVLRRIRLALKRTTTSAGV